MGDSELDRRLLETLFGNSGIEDAFGNMCLNEPRAPPPKNYRVLDPRKENSSACSNSHDFNSDDEDDGDSDGDSKRPSKSESGRDAAGSTENFDDEDGDRSDGASCSAGYRGAGRKLDGYLGKQGSFSCGKRTGSLSSENRGSHYGHCETDRSSLSNSNTAVEDCDLEARMQSLSRGERSSMMIVPQLMTLPTHSGHQTGPKGVLADFQWQQHMDFDMNIAAGNMQPPVPPSRSFSRRNGRFGVSNEYGAANTAQEGANSGRPVHRNYREIRPAQFIKEIEGAHRETPVVLHLFDRSVDECRALDRHFAQLATRYGFVKFLRLDVARYENLSIDRIALPAIQLYRGGDLSVSRMRVSDEIAGGKPAHMWDDDDVEQYLLSIGFISEDDEYQEVLKFSSRYFDISSEDDF